MFNLSLTLTNGIKNESDPSVSPNINEKESLTPKLTILLIYSYHHPKFNKEKLLRVASYRLSHIYQKRTLISPQRDLTQFPHQFKTMRSIHRRLFCWSCVDGGGSSSGGCDDAHGCLGHLSLCLSL